MRTPDAPDADKTLDLLWERIRLRGDLPGFTKAISAVLDAMHGEEEREFNMTQTVMSDPGLTQKVLRLANSAMYSAFGQSVSTVSKAVMVLGTQTIGHLALGSKLIDELSATPLTRSAPVLKWKRPCSPGMWRARSQPPPIAIMPKRRWCARCCTRWAG